MEPDTSETTTTSQADTPETTSDSSVTPHGAQPCVPTHQSHDLSIASDPQAVPDQHLEIQEFFHTFVGPDNIFLAATGCRRLFQEYLQSDRLFGKQVAELQNQFQIWTTSLNVFSLADVCLDNRVANCPEKKELVTTILANLGRNLEHGKSLLLLIFQLSHRFGLT